jgi:16S rRNA (cytosine967-C5)-methyltransferase
VALLKGVNGQKPREIAARVLQQRRAGGDFTESLLEKALSPATLSSPDRRLCQELVYGVVRWQAALDWLIARKTDGRTQKLGLQTLLRLGLYQIFWLDRIPDHAAVHETVEMAKQAGFGPQAGFINAVLRSFLRELDQTQRALADLKNSHPALGHSHPEWLVTRWQKLWGTEVAARLMDWNNCPPKTFARVNTLKAEPARLLDQWRTEEVDYDFVRRDWFEENLVFELKSHPPLAQLPSFRDGAFYVQDPSTLLAVRELDPQPGEAVLDLCAAPGGKTTYIAQRVRNEAHIIARDTSEDRLKLIGENCARLGVSCVETQANQPSTISHRPFDRVLIDAPCSNTGVMRRRVDLRWRIEPGEIERLAGTQLELLSQAAPLVRPGGTLVYSTCSLEPEENAAVLQQFLGTHPAFKLERERQLLPFADAVDGAYVARLRRT